MQVVAGAEVKHADHEQSTSAIGIAESPRAAVEGEQIPAIAPANGLDLHDINQNRGNHAQTAEIAGGSSCRGEHKFSAPAHTGAPVQNDYEKLVEDARAVQNDYEKLVEDARADLMIAAAAARMTGLVSSLKANIHGNPKTLGEINAFAHGVSTAVLAIGFLRPEVREAYADVLNAAIRLSTRCWQARRAVNFVVEGVASEGGAR